MAPIPPEAETAPDRRSRPGAERDDTAVLSANEGAEVTPLSLAAGLAAAVGNRTMSRVVAKRAGPFGVLREHAPPADPPAPAPAGGPQPDPAAQPSGPQPTLDPEAAKRLLYAQTVLSKVPQLPEGEKANLNKMVGGSDLMNVIERRDKVRSELAQAKTDLESAKDISGADKDAESKKAQAKVDQLGLDLEGLQTEVDQGLKKLGIGTEEELVELVGKFPETWKKRAKEIAGKMLDENEAVADQESSRYDYFNQGARAVQGADDVSALRAADNEIAGAIGDLMRLEFRWRARSPR